MSKDRMTLFDTEFKGLYTGGSVPVATAIVCLDCQMITSGDHCCPSCTSTSIIALKPIIGCIEGEALGGLTEWLTPAELRRNAKAAREANREAVMAKRVAEKPRLKVVGAKA